MVAHSLARYRQVSFFGGASSAGATIKIREVRGMFAEVAKPISLALCIVSLYAVFHGAFLHPDGELGQKIWDSLGRLALAAVISLVSGLIFREEMTGQSGHQVRLREMLPLQIFFWASGLMLVLFVVCWYLETYCVFYRDVRWW
jgi:hypothetical protein